MTHTATANSRVFLSYFAVFVLFGGLQSHWQTINLNDWQTINLNDRFSVRLPAGFSRRPANETDDERGEYEKGETKVVYIWGRTESLPYSERRQTWMNDYHESTT